MDLDFEAYNEMFKHEGKVKNLFNVEEAHINEINELTNNGKLLECDLEIGLRFDDCISLRIAAEQLGYVAKADGGHGYEGFPPRYHLIKKIGQDI